MPIRRASDYRRSRWKNGGGETAEIVVVPPGADLETFDWRISMASVKTDGPFSAFPGVDRTLAMLEGAGITVVIGDAPARTLTTTSDPLSFPGDAFATATLVAGPVRDFNVMTRRGRFSHTVRRRQLAPGDMLTSGDGVSVVFCADGVLEFTSGAASTRLESSEALVLDAAEISGWRLRAVVPTMLYVVAISPADSRA